MIESLESEELVTLDEELARRDLHAVTPVRTDDDDWDDEEEDDEDWEDDDEDWEEDDDDDSW